MDLYMVTINDTWAVINYYIGFRMLILMLMILKHYIKIQNESKQFVVFPKSFNAMNTFFHLRSDIAWRLGIDQDVMNETIRTIEVRNWILKQVIGKRIVELVE